MSKHIGRFEIIRELGRGAQSVVYLAQDPHLQREVAIKTLHFSRHDPQQNQQLLSEARTASQLRHPNIVPIFEAGEASGDPYLVFEYVPGQNLGELLKREGRLSPAKALAIFGGVLDAIGHAHESGIVHRDLKPSNILIDDKGTVRIMDFGIAGRIEAQTEAPDALSGTLCYMAPEYIGQRVSNERSDIFSAGLVLYEMLVGAPAVAGTNRQTIFNRLTTEDIRLPAVAGLEVDAALASLLYRALARDPEQRIASARQFHEILDDYLKPSAPSPSADATQGTIDFLLRRMRVKSDFPALSDSVSTINKITRSDKESIAALSASILKDFSLTNKILRLVNSVYYRQAGGGSISTISRAVLVLGFDAVRNMAVTVMLFEHMQDKVGTGNLKDEFLRANLAAVLAKDIGEKNAPREVEQAFICALFHGLGRLLCHYHFVEESQEIRRLVEQKSVSEEVAALQVLGVSFEDLGMGIAKSWGFPSLIFNAMRKLPAGKVRKATTNEERMRVLSSLANELCGMISTVESDQRQTELRKMSARFGENFPQGEQGLREAIDRSFVEISQFATIIGINMKQSVFGKQMRAWGAKTLSGAEKDREGSVGGETILAEGVPTGALGATSPEDASAATDGVVSSEAILMAGIQDISNTLVEEFKLNDLLRIILETMFRAKNFKRVILCVRDPQNNRMVGRFGFGPDAIEVAQRFKFSLEFTPDIFHAALSKNVDILISDTGDAKITGRIPDWFRKGVNAGTFVIFPLSIKNVAVAMIYADADLAGEIVISERELALLRTLRNQAVLAIKQSS
ncbi:serine/threonine protein kinase [Propionivibrio dicarboxylicus]|uniref:Serine/threonine protein kinase n=1 Tax=Propionivibrio dicarboxylicus TaxID=83767 RepID=A0A1G8CUD0_9RHOO|nr:serine/threonine protein kinase [Propionivibrio dicarboxylicus]SDH49058.1 Serine/threonine protein kinase [Propionivibrio dicarboxylicus]